MIINIKSKLLCSAIVSLLLSGCAGTHLSSEEVNQFTIGQDTESAVKAKLGEPWETFPAIDEKEITYILTNIPEIKPKDYIHRLGVYTFSFSPLLNGDHAYYELNIFAYSPDGILRNVAEYTCYSQKGCEDILEAEKQKFAVEDLRKIREDVENLIKDKKKKQELEAQQRKAEQERARRLAAAKAENVKSKTASSGKSATATVVTPAASVAKKVEQPVAAPAQTPAQTPAENTAKPAVRRNMGL